MTKYKKILKQAKQEEEEDDDGEGGGGNKDRAKKLYYTQRWNGAYPYGGHERATKPIRMDPDIQRYLSTVARRGSSEEILTSKEKKLYTGLAPVTESFEPVSFAQQFKNFANFQVRSLTAGLSPKNMELWLTQAHILDGDVVTLKDIRKICKQFR